MKKKDRDRCPTCGRLWAGQAVVRKCHRCKKVILRGHKWTWVTIDDGVTTVAHRNCKDPASYFRS